MLKRCCKFRFTTRFLSLPLPLPPLPHLSFSLSVSLSLLSPTLTPSRFYLPQVPSKIFIHPSSIHHHHHRHDAPFFNGHIRTEHRVALFPSNPAPIKQFFSTFTLDFLRHCPAQTCTPPLSLYFPWPRRLSLPTSSTRSITSKLQCGFLSLFFPPSFNVEPESTC